MSLPTPEAMRELLLQRRSITNFTEEPIPSTLIQQAVEVVRWVPNHSLTEPWYFTLLGRETVAKAAMLDRALLLPLKGAEIAETRAQRWLTTPGWLLVSVETAEDELRRKEDAAATAAAVQSLLLLLWAEGVGSKWLTWSLVRTSEFATLVQLPARHEVVALVAYGKAAQVGRSRRSKGLELIYRELP